MNMAEPTSTTSISISALAVALLGPLAGPYALIVFSALAGSLWPLSATIKTESRAAGAWLLLRCVLMAVVLVGSAAAMIERIYNVPAVELLAPLAFVVGALGNGWRSVMGAIADAIKTTIKRIGGSP
jgi:hypothetical protein